jgi:hypothetical protein
MRGVPLPGRIGHTCGVPQQPAVRAIPFSLPRSPCYAASLSPFAADQPTSCREPSKSTSRQEHAISSLGSHAEHLTYVSVHSIYRVSRACVASSCVARPRRR